ncbi:UNKNOWN [Stylonychia lemnae]|uniref:Transmembrane protein n=1 Tax=Stylonychia lemnae TaxID=5949 RepID=A0A078A0I7_STYLE|nr:UNKNOWN [Stylonychia lemnae]|eukprot:CDW75362.1 UNKNOWN [Stylonychia lemnae]
MTDESKIKTSDELNFQLVSGQILNFPLRVGLFDQDDQLVINDNSSLVLLMTKDTNLSLFYNRFIPQRQASKACYLFFWGGIQSECRVGYEGRLCSICSKDVNGSNYGRANGSQCVECEPLDLQVMKFIGILFGLGAYVGYLQYSILSSQKRNKPQTVLMRIFTNYFQAIMIVKSFDLNWPKQVEDSLTYFSIVGSQSESIFSLDCLYKQSLNSQIPTQYIKVIFFGLMPFIFSALGTIIWISIYIYKKINKLPQIKLWRGIQVTSYMFSYLFYPMITNQTFSLFSCQSFENNQSFLKADYDIECWVGTHRQMVLCVGIPLVFFWVLGFPLWFFVRLYQNKKNFKDPEVVSRFGLFFIGLNDNQYYWEILLINFRKIIFILCSTLLSEVNASIKLIHSVKPYIDPRFNDIEKQSVYAATLSLYGGIFFLQNFNIRDYEDDLKTFLKKQNSIDSYQQNEDFFQQMIQVQRGEQQIKKPQQQLDSLGNSIAYQKSQNEMKTDLKLLTEYESFNSHQDRQNTHRLQRNTRNSTSKTLKTNNQTNMGDNSIDEYFINQSTMQFINAKTNSSNRGKLGSITRVRKLEKKLLSSPLKDVRKFSLRKKPSNNDQISQVMAFENSNEDLPAGPQLFKPQSLLNIAQQKQRKIKPNRYPSRLDSQNSQGSNNDIKIQDLIDIKDKRNQKKLQQQQNLNAINDKVFAVDENFDQNLKSYDRSS